jgi:hypothetical protein
MLTNAKHAIQQVISFPTMMSVNAMLLGTKLKLKSVDFVATNSITAIYALTILKIN